MSARFLRLCLARAAVVDATPERNSPHVGAPPELDVCVEVARARAPCRGGRDGELTRHRDGRSAASAECPAAGGVEDDAADLPRPGASTGVVEARRSASTSCPRARRPNDTAVGAAKRSGRSARCSATTPPPWNRAPAVRPRSSTESTPDCTSADFSCSTVHAGWRWRRRAAAPGDVRRRHARPRELGPAAAGDRREDVDSRRCDVRLQA